MNNLEDHAIGDKLTLPDNECRLQQLLAHEIVGGCALQCQISQASIVQESLWHKPVLQDHRKPPSAAHIQLCGEPQVGPRTR